MFKFLEKKFGPKKFQGFFCVKPKNIIFLKNHNFWVFLSIMLKFFIHKHMYEDHLLTKIDDICFNVLEDISLFVFFEFWLL